MDPFLSACEAFDGHSLFLSISPSPGLEQHDGLQSLAIGHALAAVDDLLRASRAETVFLLETDRGVRLDRSRRLCPLVVEGNRP